MSERYTHQLLKVVVAQVCQTIGWHSIQSTPLELLIDILDQYLRDITRLTHRYSELYNRTDPNLDDVALAFREIGMNLGELQEYLQFVDPIERPFEVPRYPLPKESHLNFLKPGSKEVLTRPVHIPEHMPPMLVDSEEEQEEARRRLLRLRSEVRGEVEDGGEVQEEADFGGMVVEKMEEVGAEEVALMETSQSEEVVTFKRPPEVVVKNEEGRPTREISSVIMTTSGFISPAREGKLPDSKIPEIPEEKPKLPPPPPPAPALPVAKMDEKFGGKKGKKRPAEKEKKKDKKGDKKKEGGGESRPASRPATPSSVTEDIKPLVEAVPEEIPQEVAPVLDVKPPPETLVPPAPEVPPPVIPPPLPETPSKIKKEKPKRKKPPLKSPQPPPHMMMNSPLMDVGLFPPQMPFQQSAPPPLIPPMALMNQITPPKPPKPKRPKFTKKQLMQQQQQQFQPPLNAQNILDIMTGNSGAKMPPNLFSPTAQPPSLFPPQQQQQQQSQLNAAQTQLDILQKLHPSLEITPAPGPPSPEKHKLNVFKKVAKTKTSPNPPPPLTSSGPIIVIDDDKSPPHQPQFPVTPMAKKRTNTKNTPSTGGFQFQDALSSPDFGLNPEQHGPTSSSSFREFSPPKTPSNMPKTPDIKLQSSSSSSTSWMSDSGKLGGGPGPLFGDFPPNFGLGGMPVPKEEKKKKPRQRPVKDVASKKSKSAQLMDDMLQQFQQQQHQQHPLPPVLPGLDKKQLSEYSKLLNQAMPPGAAALFNNPAVRNPMFGMFPLPSGPGLIPDNPLFGTFPGQPSFLPSGPFGLPTIPPRFDLNMLRYPRPPKPTPPESFDNLDPETKLAHTPLDLQKSTCNVAPLVPPSLQIDQPPPQEQSLNLSTKPSVITPNPTHEPGQPVQQQQLAAPAPNVPPIAPGETIVIGSDSDTNSQSEQIPMGGGGTGGDGGLDEQGEGAMAGSAGGKKDKSEKRKNKEHKKDRKLKEGKIKKKKDKKDKNRSKERDRERPK